ncbi:FAD-dependent monooxygenase [Nocardia sp. NBC_00508]|uniref:FAD-dependent oxidoreductase n=1 Tax=Nocardia sp. NBC_00508 TaxID=2975992 RepID=UPI002E80DA38|nr:FAD-dependent monooxygenase [Nocardia sp. NBC_00508]WUD66064.1 FAD-dependent monooxygenase [Nocardia sp. NBC_00508]
MKAMIIGCGIGGPTVAMALAQAGIESVIYEAYDTTADGIGSFLNIASNGLDALRVLGAHKAVMAAGIPTPHMVMWSGTGKRLGQVENGLRLDDGTVSHTIQRPDFYRIVRDEAAARGIPIEYGKRLVALRETTDDVTAIFADGSTATADLLIAADGVHSTTRKLLDPAAPGPRYSGLLSMGGVVSDPKFTGEPGVYNMIFGKKAFFGYSVAESGQTWWFANLPMAQEPSREALANTDWKQALIEEFACDNNDSAEIVRRGSVELALPVYDLPPIPTWHRGRAVLTGDAAHATSPSSGQGASLAIEDGLILAKCLRDLPDHTAAFQRFEQLRRARAERVVEFSRKISNSKAAGPVARVFRDLMMPIFLKKAANAESLAWLYRHHIDWTSPQI